MKRGGEKKRRRGRKEKGRVGEGGKKGERREEEIKRGWGEVRGKRRTGDERERHGPRLRREIEK